jgi:AcrR family transcriptional regulator
MEDIARDGMKNRIIDVASKMFMKHSCKQVTMDAIAKEMGISKRTIYENFSDKEMLLEKCVCRIMHNDTLIEQFSSSSSNPNVLLTVTKILALHTSESFRLRCASATDIMKYYPEIYENCIVPNNQQITKAVKAMFKTSQENGYIYPQVNVDIATAMLGEMIKAVLHDNVSLGEYSKSELIEQSVFFYVRGMATSKALKEYEIYIAENPLLMLK